MTRIKFIYCTDNVLDMQDNDTLEIMAESLKMNPADLRLASSSPMKESVSGASSAKQTPGRMDAERRS